MPEFVKILEKYERIGGEVSVSEIQDQSLKTCIEMSSSQILKTCIEMSSSQILTIFL